MKSILSSVRRFQRALMHSTVRAETVTVGEWDPELGEYDEIVEETHYQGRALITPEPDRLHEVEVGDGQVGVTLYRVVIDYGADVPRNARVTVESSPDAALEGVQLTVFDYKLSDLQASRALVCREER